MVVIEYVVSLLLTYIPIAVAAPINDNPCEQRPTQQLLQ